MDSYITPLPWPYPLGSLSHGTQLFHEYDEMGYAGKGRVHRPKELPNHIHPRRVIFEVNSQYFVFYLSQSTTAVVHCPGRCIAFAFPGERTKSVSYYFLSPFIDSHRGFIGNVALAVQPSIWADKLLPESSRF